VSYGGRLEAIGTVPSGTQVTVTSVGGGTDAVPLTAGPYTPSSFLTHFVARLNAVNHNSWSGSLSTGPSGTGLVTLSNSGGNYSVTFDTAEVGTFMGFVGNISTTSSPSIGTRNARGLWLPRCPLLIDGHPSRAPKLTDARSTVGPTGRSVALKGTSKYRHRGLKWTHITAAQCFEGSASTTYASLQQWIDDTQFGDGHSWFRVGSAFQVYWSNNGTDSIVGSDLNSGAGPSTGWTCQPAISSFEPVRAAQPGLLSYWTWEMAELVSEG
jgi:hypothetical protein